MNLCLLLGLLISGLQCGDLLASKSNKNQSNQTLFGSYRNLQDADDEPVVITPLDIILNTPAFQKIDPQDDRSLLERIVSGLFNKDTTNEDLISMQKKVVGFLDRHNEIGGVYLDSSIDIDSHDENTNIHKEFLLSKFESGSGVRKFEKKITFKRPFNCAKPQVIVSWTAVDNNPDHSFRYEVSAKEVKPESFTLEIKLWDSTTSDMLGAQYIARC